MNNYIKNKKKLVHSFASSNQSIDSTNQSINLFIHRCSDATIYQTTNKGRFMFKLTSRLPNLGSRGREVKSRLLTSVAFIHGKT